MRATWQARRCDRGGDEGAILILVLAFVLFFGLVGSSVLTLTQANLTTTSVTVDQSQLQYGADAGIQWAKSQAAAQGGACGSIPGSSSGSSAAVPNLAMAGISQVNVQCDPIAGAGANTFSNGYSVITGDGYPQNSSCESLVSDALGGGVTTDAQGTQSCVTYKSTGTGSSVWVNLTSPVTADLSDVFTLDNNDVWAVGKAAGGQETILYYDGDDWSDITTATNTGGVTNADLIGVYAADANDVWVAGNAGNTPVVLYCSSACTTPLATWTKQTLPSSPTSALTAITGFGKTVWAVGQHYDAGGPPPVHKAQVLTGSSSSSTWTSQAFTTPAPADLTGVYGSDATHLWAVGKGGAVYVSANAGSSWTSQTDPNNKDLNAVSGIPGTNNLWAVGQNVDGSDYNVITSSNGGVTWSQMSFAAAGAGQLDGVTALVVSGTTFVWAVGNGGILTRWDSGTNAWTVQTPPTVTTTPPAPPPPANPNFFGVSGTTTTAEVVFAVGQGGTIDAFAPSKATTQTLAKISGGNIYNGNTATFRSGVEVTNGNFQQFSNTVGCSAQPPSALSKLTMDNGFQYCTTTATPASIAASLTEPMPNAVPAAPVKPAGCPGTWTVQNGCLVTVTGDANCKSYVVFPPGDYTTAPSLNQNNVHTYFFQTGIDYFDNVNFSPLDDPNNNLWIIGGQPDTANDKPQIFNANTPCYSELTSSPLYTQGTGFGVEWILGGQTWFDVHSVHLELFTRVGGPASEGAQGISLREVPPACSASVLTGTGITGSQCGVSGWSTRTNGPSVPAGQPGQIFQVDQNNHEPEVFVHGGIFAPHNNIELYTNTTGDPNSLVYTGPIDVNSIELSSQASGGNVIIGAGGAATTTLQLTAVSTGNGANGGLSEQPFTEQAVIKETTPTWKTLGWRVCSGTSPGSGASYCKAVQK